MNKILSLFSEEYVISLFKKQLLPLYPQYQNILGVEIKPYKKMIWDKTYHVVIAFNVNFITPGKKQEKILVVCSAHSSEPRENVFLALQYLWKYDFNSKKIYIPRPLFYSPYFQGTFYQGLKGENLMYYIKNKNYQIIEEIIPLAAKIFARLHQLPVENGNNFNPYNSRIKTVVPGVDMILKEMSRRFGGKFEDSFRKIYKKLIEGEEKYLANHKIKQCLIHGDAHTENIIHVGDEQVGLIDFTDICVGDSARDIGTFMQQLEYKINAYESNRDYAQKMSKLFLDSYLAFNLEVDNKDLDKRIRLYYDWTAVRTAVYLFLKHDSDPESAEYLLEKSKKDLAIT